MWWSRLQEWAKLTFSVQKHTFSDHSISQVLSAETDTSNFQTKTNKIDGFYLSASSLVPMRKKKKNFLNVLLIRNCGSTWPEQTV